MALPRIDTHTVDIDASAARVWDVVVTSMERALSGRAALLYATVMRAEHRDAAGPRPLDVGSTVPGFRVVRSRPHEELVLTGKHHLAEYEMVFALTALGEHRTRLAVTTNAAFAPGLGTAYRALVIGSRGHVLATRRLLATLRRRAER